MTTEEKKFRALRLTRPLSDELEQLRQLNYGLFAQENVMQNVCTKVPVNFIGTLLYATHASDFISRYAKDGFVPHPDLYNPFKIIENVGIHRMDISIGAWVPADLTARCVLVKQICGTRVGLVLGSTNNADPLAGLLLRSHKEHSDFTVMCAVRLMNDEPCTEKKFPDDFRSVDRSARARTSRVFELIEFEKRIVGEVKQHYLKRVEESRANLTTGKVMTSHLLNQLFIETGIDADVEYFHMTKW